jgi:transcriptional regulator with XRE-family HTH domain
MSMTVGQAIVASRKRQGIKAAEVAAALGISPPAYSAIENDLLKGGPDDAVVVKISEFLNDRSIRIVYLENDLVYRSILPKVFEDLNCIREEPAIILSRYVLEAEESMEAAKILIGIFSNADPSRMPNYRETLLTKLEQVVDVARCAEILFEKMIKLGVLTEEDRILIHARQQRKCEANGHHNPVEVAA